MLIISIHMSLPSPVPHTPETNGIIHIEKSSDDVHQNSTNGILPIDKDIPFGSLLTARCCFGTASLNDMIYVVGGYNRGDCLNTIEQYNPHENQWRLLPYSMTSRRGRVSVTIINNKIYAFGGSDGQKELNTGEYFDIKSMNKWAMIKELSTPVAHGGKFIIS
jgi:hypothetical protein